MGDIRRQLMATIRSQVDPVIHEHGDDIESICVRCDCPRQIESWEAILSQRMYEHDLRTRDVIDVALEHHAETGHIIDDISVTVLPLMDCDLEVTVGDE